jgi:hypothetical protein
MKRDRPWWLDWYVIWRVGAIVFLGICLVIGVTRFLWDLESSFSDQLRDKGYPAATIERSTTSLGGNKSQQLYTARVQVGTCLLRLERTQSDSDFYLEEVNGTAVDDPDDSPSKEQALAFLGGKNIFCSR